MIVFHLKTQRNQPYGSVRRCCEECGIMLWGPGCEPWTDDLEIYYDSPPDGHVPCNKKLQENSDGEEDRRHET